MTNRTDNPEGRKRTAVKIAAERKRLINRITEIRDQIGPVEGDSTDIIRAWRDNDEPYR
jgi:hypothetical protein